VAVPHAARLSGAGGRRRCHAALRQDVGRLSAGRGRRLPPTAYTSDLPVDAVADVDAAEDHRHGARVGHRGRGGGLGSAR
jgi:hypothetical protein